MVPTAWMRFSARFGFGRIIEFRDPDGHELYLWQMPRKGEPAYEHVKPLAEHYARLRAALDG